MRNLIILIVFASLFSCSLNSNKINAQVYSTQDGEFIIDIDTINVNIKPYVNPDKVGLTHAIKYKDKYYCYFTDKEDSYSKYFFVISNKGTIEKEIKLPRDLTDCFYLDLFVLHDTIFSKPYMNDQSYYLDLQTLNWVETPEPDDVIYEDERYYVTYLDFGEWGSTTWFKDKLSGKEYELESSAYVINMIDSSYFISNGFRVLRIDNPTEMKQCDKEYYYQIIKRKEFSEGINSLLGAKIIFKDTTYSQWEFKKPKQYIITSFKKDKRLFYLCNNSTMTFVSKIQDGKIIPILNLGKKYSVFDWHYSYRCKIQKDNFQLLKFHDETNDKYGFIEIYENKITIQYLNLNNT